MTEIKSKVAFGCVLEEIVLYAKFAERHSYWRLVAARHNELHPGCFVHDVCEASRGSSAVNTFIKSIDDKDYRCSCRYARAASTFRFLFHADMLFGIRCKKKSFHFFF